MKPKITIGAALAVAGIIAANNARAEQDAVGEMPAASGPRLAKLQTEAAVSQGQPKPDEPKSEAPDATGVTRAPVTSAWTALGSGGGYGGYGGGGMGGAYSQRLQNIIKRPDGHGGAPLIIQSSEPDPKEKAKLQQDLTVMAHILDKSVSEVAGRDARFRNAMGIDVFYPESRPIQNLYLEGYGVLFTLHAGFPLLALPSKSGDEKGEANRDSAWEEAKQELYGEASDGGVLVGATPAPPQKFDEAKVDQLKQSLLESLKSAANIRNLKADDSITLCVFGTVAGAARNRHTTDRVAVLGDVPATRLLWSDNPGSRTSLMTIRVKKADVDAFAKGSLSADDFRKQAQISIYSADAGGDFSQRPN